MTPQAIAKLRRSFIAITTISFFVVIAFMGFMSFVVSSNSMRNQASRTIDAIIEAGGEMPRPTVPGDASFQQEAIYGLRYFTVSFDDDGEVIEVDMTHVASIDRERAIEIALVAADPTTVTGLGSFENYFYKEGTTDAGSMVVFLDCAVQMAITREVGMNTLFISTGALAAVFLTVLLLSRRAIAPEVESARRQQQFVTNASHELKTPISVIRANTEVTEMIGGETEWTQSTLRQVDRLENLVGSLMTIARGAEREGSEGSEGGTGDVDVTAVIADAVESFRSRAMQGGLGLEAVLDDDVHMAGSASVVEQLACLLIDNAIKYCDPDGAVVVRLTQARIGRGCSLTVSNDYADGSDVDYRRFFDRFYREDEAHENQQGYGIGLSVAESICKRYHGTIKAAWKGGVISFTCMLKGM